MKKEVGRAPKALDKRAQWDEKVVKALLSGVPKETIVVKLAKGSKRREKAIRARIRTLYARNEELQKHQIEQFNGGILEGIPDAGDGLMRRASRGRVDAIKLALEATGIHNPRVKHEHSGDIKITLDMPRPPRQMDQLEEPIVDADVVEDAGPGSH